MVSSTFLIVSFAAATHALNDWSKPCLSGVCSYDIPDSAGSSSGSLKIWGSSDAISDITVAAGWEIISCSPDELTQDIRLVCNSDNSTAAGCSHLYEGSGAEGKIVRLPESCGKNAFARVARAWIPDDQTIPESVTGKIVRRDGSQPQVKALALDTDFHTVDPSKGGPVNFAVQGANVKGAAADIDISSLKLRRRSRVYGKENLKRGPSDFIGNAIDSIKNLDTFNVNKTLSSPFSVDQSFNLLNEQLSCPPITASFTIDVDAKANGVANLGVAASGTIIPPKVDNFSVIISLSGDIDGSVTMKATASGTLESPKLKLFEVGIPRLDFPGLLTIGPSFEVNAQASAGLDTEADTTVGLNYHFDKAQLVFPGDSNQTNTAGNSFTIDDTPLKLSVSPSVQATGNVQAHLIPSLNLKVSALGDIVNAGIFLNLDASAEMNLSLEATAQANTTINKAKRERPKTIGRYMPRALVVAEVPPVNSAAPVNVAVQKSTNKSTVTSPAATPADSNTATSSSAASANSSPATSSATPANSSTATFSVATPANSITATFSAAIPANSITATSSAATPANSSTVATPPDASASFGGCFQVNAGLDVGAGADSNFFGLFDENTSVSLFNKTFQIFKKCFGNQKRSLAVVSSLTNASLKRRAGLTCPATGSDPAVSVADQVVQAGAIVSTA